MDTFYIITASLLGGAGIGSAISMGVNHFLEKSRLKKERAFTLQKEIYFNLQQKAEDILRGLTYYIKIYEIFYTDIVEYKDYKTLGDTEANEERQENLRGALLIYFPSLEDSFDSYSDAVDNYIQKVFDISKTKKLPKKDLEDFKQLRKIFYRESRALQENVMKSLKNNREKLQ